jgi:hypothetical protein
MLRVLVLLACALGLAGCATSTAPQPPTAAELPPAVVRPLPAVANTTLTPRYVHRGRGGCGSRGGAGYRLPNGKCAGRRR